MSGRVTLTPMGLSQKMRALRQAQDERKRGGKPAPLSKRAVAGRLKVRRREEGVIARQKPASTMLGTGLLDVRAYENYLRTGYPPPATLVPRPGPGRNKMSQELDAEALRLIDKYMTPVAEPARLPPCPPMIREQSRATQSARHRFVGPAGEWRTRMPMGVIVTSFFLRVGNVLPSAILGILDREAPSTSGPAGDGREPPSGVK